MPRTLIASIRNKGAYVCPLCLVKMKDVDLLGKRLDRKVRQQRRIDDERRQHLVQEARTAIFRDGCKIKLARVDNGLKIGSYVPVQVSPAYFLT